MIYNKILVPLDGSEMSESSLEHVKAIAKGCQVPEVVLLAVVGGYEPGSGWSWGGIVSESFAVKDAEKETAGAKSYLSKIAQKLAKDGIAVSTDIMVGTPADTILEYAAGTGVDLIIMATHGRSGPARWALGSVADRVVRYSTVPVMIVSPKSK